MKFDVPTIAAGYAIAMVAYVGFTAYFHVRRDKKLRLLRAELAGLHARLVATRVYWEQERSETLRDRLLSLRDSHETALRFCVIGLCSGTTYGVETCLNIVRGTLRALTAEEYAIRGGTH